MRKRVKVWRWLGVIGLLLTLVAGARAQTEGDGLREVQLATHAFDRSTPVPAWVTLGAMPDTSVPVPAQVPLQVLLAETHLKVNAPSGWLTHRVVRANHSGSLQRLGQLLLSFNPAFQRLSLHRLVVWRNGQAIDHTSGVPIKFLQREAELEQGVYRGDVSVSIVVPDLREGDTLQLVYSVTGSNPILGSRYADGAGWDEVWPVALRRITLTSPLGRTPRWRWHGGPGQPTPVDPRRERVGDTERLVFEGRDLPAVEVEPHLPPEAFALRWLQFSEYEDWNQVARWAAQLFHTEAPVPPELAGLVQTLRAEADESLRASLALQWVQKNIRYHAVHLGESSHRPHSPEQVLRNRYGDCKDKSLLLLGLLRAAGLQAEPVLVSLRRQRAMDGLLPSPAAFDHAVVRVVAGRETHYLDATRQAQTGRLNRLGQHLEGFEVLLAHPEAQGAEVVRAVQPDQVFRSDLTERFVLPTLDGPAEMVASWTFRGVAAESLRDALPRLSAPQWEQWALRGIERRYPGVTLVEPPQFQDDEPNNRIEARMRYRIPKPTTQLDGTWGLRFMAENLRGAFSLPERLTRQFPVPVFTHPMRFHYQIEVQWPEEVAALEDPSTRRQDTPFFRLRVDSAFRGREARRTVQFEPLVDRVPAADLPRLVEELDKLPRTIDSMLLVGRDQIKRAGFLGLGRQNVVDKMREEVRGVIAGTTRALEQSGLRGEERVDALCSRAMAHADLGEPAKGLPDAQAAARVGPRSANAAWCLATLQFASGDFAAAGAAFSRALSLGHDALETHYRRGIARFYLGDLGGASDDFDKALAAEGDDGTRQFVRLWHAWTLLQQGRPLSGALLRDVAPQGDWPRPALAMLAGQLSPEALIQEVERKSPDERVLGLAEAWFYVGQWHKAQGQIELARQAFEKALAQNVTPYLEHVGAGFELQPPTGTR